MSDVESIRTHPADQPRLPNGQYETAKWPVLTYGPTPHLDGKHTVFGRVTAGMDVLRSLRERDPGRDRAPGDRIDTVEIEEGAPVS